MKIQGKQGEPVKNMMAVKKELYNRIRLHVSDLLGRHDQEIRKSEKALARLFSQRWTKDSHSAFQESLTRSQWVFWGDFHGVRQSQKTVLRWLSATVQPEDSFCLALECLPTSSQKHLDQYLSGKLSEREFLSKVKWGRVWGFPFDHYRPLLEWAKVHKRPVLALNAPANNKTLAQREKWAINVLSDFQSKNLQSKIWILFGEYHLLPQHFSKRVPKRIKCTYVFQNSDSLYFRRPHPSDHELILKGPKSFYCLQNVPPWVKWQTYLLFLDVKEDREIEESHELTDHVVDLAKILAQELGLTLNENEFNVLTNDEATLWENLKKEASGRGLPAGSSPQYLFENFIAEGMSFVSPELEWAYLSRISVNEAASLAMQILYFQQSKAFRWPQSGPLFWDRLIWVLGFSYFGSKLINPHRKTPTLRQLQNFVRSSQRPFERQAARLAVSHMLQRSLGTDTNHLERTASDRVRFLALRWLAGLMGERIYQAYREKRLSLDNLKMFIGKDPNQKNFKVFLQELQEVLSG